MCRQKTAKNLAEAFVYHVGNGLDIPQHFAKGYDLVWYSLFYLTHVNGRNRKQYFSRWSPCFGFFVCPCYNRRKHPTLEKPGAQNITAYENQGKQCELSDHWKPKQKKVVFEKKK